MPFTRHAIYGDASAWHDAPLVGLSGRIEHNLGSQSIADEKGRLGSTPLSFSSGAFSVDMPATDDAAVVAQVTGTLQYRVVLNFTDPGGGGRRTWDSGWFSLTADVNVFTVEGAVSPEAAVSGAAFLAEMEAIRDAAIAPTETQVRSVVTADIGNPATDIGSALSETIGAEVPPIVADRASQRRIVKFAPEAEVEGVAIYGIDKATGTLYGASATARTTLLRCSDPTLRVWETVCKVAATAGAATSIANVLVTQAGTLLVNLGTTTTNQWVRVSADGSTQTPVITDPTASTLRNSACQLPNGTILIGTYYSAGLGPYTLTLYRSRDDGATFTAAREWPDSGSASTYAQRHIHNVHADPHVPGRAWFSFGDWDNQSRVYYTDDEGDTVVEFGGGSQKFRSVTMLFTPTEIVIAQDNDDNSGTQPAKIIGFDRATKAERVIFDSTGSLEDDNRAGAFYYGALASDDSTFMWSTSDVYPSHLFAGTLDGSMPTQEIEAVPLAQGSIRVNSAVYVDAADNFYVTTWQETSAGQTFTTRRGRLIRTFRSDARAVRGGRTPSRSIAVVGDPYSAFPDKLITLVAGRMYAVKIPAGPTRMQVGLLTLRTGTTSTGNIRAGIAAAAADGGIGAVLGLTDSAAVAAPSTTMKIVMPAPVFLAADTEYWLLIQASAATQVCGVDSLVSLVQHSRINTGVSYPFGKALGGAWTPAGVMPAVILTDG